METITFQLSQLKEFIGNYGKEGTAKLFQNFDKEFLLAIIEHGAEVSGIEDLINEHGMDKLKAVMDCDVPFDFIDESYSGKFDSDRDFAMDMADQLGSIKQDESWPYTCIDWDKAARELMMDYSESNGYYFRNL